MKKMNITRYYTGYYDFFPPTLYTDAFLAPGARQFFFLAGCTADAPISEVSVKSNILSAQSGLPTVSVSAASTTTTHRYYRYTLTFFFFFLRHINRSDFGFLSVPVIRLSL